MAKLKNVSRVPVSFDGKDGTVRFFIDDEKVIKDEDMTASLKNGIESGVLMVMPEESVAETKVEETKEEAEEKPRVNKKKGKEEA